MELKHDDLREEAAKVDQEIDEIDTLVKDLLERRDKLVAKQKNLKVKLQQNEARAQVPENLDCKSFPWSSKLDAILKKMFGITELRPFQLPTMNALLSKQDAILIMPTGGGKSLCFQLPALVANGVTLVISPLISLMEDQVIALKRLGIEAEMLQSGLARKDQTNIMKSMLDPNSNMKILYVTPERLKKSKQFMSYLEKMYKMGRFSHLAVDEVHCCSQWGHDFRPDYKFLHIMKQQFPEVPILGLTATATTSVTLDVQKMLNIEDCLLFRASFNRPNLVYKVVEKPSSQKETISKLSSLINRSYKKQSGIVYCLATKESEDIACGLTQHGIEARAYHGNLDPKLRSDVHNDWLSNKCQVVVATIAFGMGIDKADVRFVIHHSLSRSVENFYQESGRAGRDGKPADCVLFYRFADIFRISSMVFEEKTGVGNLYNMVAYCIERRRCRRSVLADHFGERWDVTDCNKMCDNCNVLLAEGGSAAKQLELTDIAEHCFAVLTIVGKTSSSNKGLTGLKIMDEWLSKNGLELKSPYSQSYTKPKLPRPECERILAHLLVEGYVKEEFHFTSYAAFSYLVKGVKADSVMSGSAKIMMDIAGSTVRKSTSRGDVPSTSKIDSEPKSKRALCLVNSENSKFKSKRETPIKKETVVKRETPAKKKVQSTSRKEIILSDSEDEYDFGDKTTDNKTVDFSASDYDVFDVDFDDMEEKPTKSTKRETESVVQTKSKRFKF